MEARRRTVESNLLSDLLFKVRCSSLLNPIRIASTGISEASNLIFNSEFLLIMQDSFAIESLSDKLLAGYALTSQESDIRVFLIVSQVEPILSASEDGIRHFLLNVLTGANSCLLLFT